MDCCDSARAPPGLPGGEPAVDPQLRPGDVRGCIGGEELNRTSEVVVDGHASERDARAELALELFVLPAEDAARRERINAHVVRAECGGEVLGEIDDRRL